MDRLNREAVKRGLPDWPLPVEVAHDFNCWFGDYERGLTPAQALDANFRENGPKRLFKGLAQ